MEDIFFGVTSVRHVKKTLAYKTFFSLYFFIFLKL